MGMDRLMRKNFSAPVTQKPRPNPAMTHEDIALHNSERQNSIKLMRINHSGEVCAQALYRGQALLARDTDQRAALLNAAAEENDHLNWCKARIKELNGKTSKLNPVWYAGSFAIGAAAAFAGDKISLGFLAETEHQVTKHLETHLEQISARDLKSRAILEQMRIDEIEHATTAEEAGATNLPSAIKILMRCTAKIMTTTAAKF